jgi:ABC-type sugar transport system ATPase subunit
MGGLDADQAPALAARSVWMRFGRTVAVRDVSLTVAPGVIHGLVGENGAGKSTFLGIVAGRLRPSAGQVEIGGHEVPSGNPRAARARGLAVIYQEMSLVPAADAVANVFLGHEVTRGGALARKVMEGRFAELCERLKIRIPRRKPVRELSVGDQQMVEIMRALNGEASLILLDEPTSALERGERERLFATLKDLRAENVTSVFVSHDLDDVLDLADDVTVFRNGESVAAKPVGEWTKPTVVEAMLGRSVERAMTQIRPQAAAVDAPGISVQGLGTPAKLRDLSFEVRSGEILGLGGLTGSGRSSMLRALGGAQQNGVSGVMTIGGRERALPRSPAEAIKLGIGLIPEDRQRAGLALGMTALENIVLAELSGGGTFLRGRERRRASQAAARAGFDQSRLDSPARDLSGGNQQKLLLARWVNVDLSLLLADEPTRGVDIGAKADILKTLRTLADDGMAIIIASSDLEDLEAVADRVLVLSRGRQVAELDRARGESITPDSVLHAAVGSTTARTR